MAGSREGQALVLDQGLRWCWWRPEPLGPLVVSVRPPCTATGRGNPPSGLFPAVLSSVVPMERPVCLGGRVACRLPIVHGTVTRKCLPSGLACWVAPSQCWVASQGPGRRDCPH